MLSAENPQPNLANTKGHTLLGSEHLLPLTPLSTSMRKRKETSSILFFLYSHTYRALTWQMPWILMAYDVTGNERALTHSLKFRKKAMPSLPVSSPHALWMPWDRHQLSNEKECFCPCKNGEEKALMSENLLIAIHLPSLCWVPAAILGATAKIFIKIDTAPALMELKAELGRCS